MMTHYLKNKKAISTATPLFGGNADIKTERLYSLDALRGFDMFWITAGEGIFHGLANATHRTGFTWISKELYHTPWNGFTFFDMIFPLFIFIAGVSMPYSFGKRIETAGIDKAKTKKQIYRSLIKRTVLLILLGIVVNGGLSFQGYQNTRFASVLGRIGVSSFLAALIYLNFSIRKQVIWFVGLLLGYWAAMMLIPVPGIGAGVLTPEGNLSAYIDRLALPGKFYRPTYDPEGLLSTIPAIATALLGVLTGDFLRSHFFYNNRFKKAGVLFIAGLSLLGIGLLWNLVFPINKDMWTSSFVLYAGGWSLVLLSIFYMVIDGAGYKKWSLPLIWVGSNSILIYLLTQGLTNFEYSANFLFGGLIAKTPLLWRPVFLWTGVALVEAALFYFFYKKKWFLKV